MYSSSLDSKGTNEIPIRFFRDMIKPSASTVYTVPMLYVYCAYLIDLVSLRNLIW